MVEGWHFGLTREDRTPRRNVGQGGDRLREERRTARVDRHDRLTEPQGRRPDRSQHQGCERVGAVGLGGPHVGETEVDQLAEPFLVLHQRNPGKGNRDPPTLDDCHQRDLSGGCSRQLRTIVD